MNSPYSPIPEKANEQPRPPRARAIIEFVEGDLNRLPVVFPIAGTDETDEAIRQEIKRRWERAA